MQVLWVCLGGALGTGLRYFVGTRLNAAWPYGTWAVNLVGSFLMGLIMVLGLERELLPVTARVALTTGFLGGLTTYSAFAYETVDAMRGGAWSFALTNFAVTTVACFAACAAGMALGRR